MKKRLRKKMKTKHGRSWITISRVSDGIWGTSLSRKNIKDLEVKRDTTNGKNLVTVKLNGELIFSYDSNFKGQYGIKNNIQVPFEDLRE